MTPERWQHIDEIFQAAIELAPDERAPYFSSVCTGDAELQHQVETLLTQYDAAGDFPDSLNEHRGTQALVSQINDSDAPLRNWNGQWRLVTQGSFGAASTRSSTHYVRIRASRNYFVALTT